jgi:hypothetical protein
VRIADELEPLARKIGQSLSVGFCLSTRAWIDFGKGPDLAKLEAAFERVPKSDREASFAHLEVLSEVQLSLVGFFRSNWTNALLHAQAARRAEPGSCMEGFGVGTIFRQLTYTGDRDGALAILDEKRTLLPRSGQTNTAGSWLMLALVIEGLVMLGDHSQAGRLYPLISEVIGLDRWCFGRSSGSRIRLRVSPRQRHASGNPLKTIFRSRCGKRNHFPICLNRRKCPASMR